MAFVFFLCPSELTINHSLADVCWLPANNAWCKNASHSHLHSMEQRPTGPTGLANAKAPSQSGGRYGCDCRSVGTENAFDARTHTHTHCLPVLPFRHLVGWICVLRSPFLSAVYVEAWNWVAWRKAGFWVIVVAERSARIRSRIRAAAVGKGKCQPWDKDCGTKFLNNMEIYFGYLRGMCSPCICNFAIDNFWLLSVYTSKKSC